MKTVIWLGSTRKDLKAMPEPVQSDFGYAIYNAQCGVKAISAYPMVGFGGAGVVEAVTDHQGGTFRAVYTVKFENAIYVLHVFQKKSKRGSQVPKPDMEVIRSRLKAAKGHSEAHSGEAQREQGK